ncbi:outer membrane beta-barrel protein [Pedobacter nyackensis]|uniref:outer membrane beta-barrel protein n=1 Tax=Pedobacter nyackensis TaxID=475255 RepID=UPI002931E87E|nr:outer membrane beta-barrel protein [Pedobacter nyackensis]
MSGALFAQQSGSSISGKVTDRNKVPVEGVTVFVLRHSDSVRIATAVTDSDGVFSILKMQPGDYQLAFSMLGFRKKYFSVSLVQNQAKYIGLLTLESTVQDLSVVSVEGRRRSVKTEAGSTTFQIDGETLGLKPNVLEILRSLPGVTMNEEGVSSLNGQQGANILINGKSTFLAGDQLINYLRALPASSVKDIQLITAPSAMHDAEGKAGLINIQMQKVLLEGWALNFNTGFEQHQNGRGNASGRFTYQKNKIGIFADYAYQSGRYSSTLNTLRSYARLGNNMNQTAFVRQNSGLEEDHTGNRLGIGLDYAVNKKIIAGLSSSGNIFSKKTPGYANAAFNIGENPVDSILRTRRQSNQKQKIFAGGAYLNYKDDKNTAADLSFDYLDHLHKENMLLNDEIEKNAGGDPDRNTMLGNVRGDIQMFSMQMNGATMVSSAVKITGGAKFVWVDVTNDALYKKQRLNGWETDDILSRRYNYTENINSIYIQTNVKAGHFDIEGGLRLEQTNVQYRDYSHLFPTLKIQYARSSEGNNLSLLYNKRITRPSYRDLSPFSYIWDEYTRTVGNPGLRSELTDHIEMAYLYRKNYRGTLFFSNTKDPIMQNIEISDNSSALLYPDNFKNNQRVGLRFDMMSLQLKSFWRAGLNSVFSYSIYGWEESGKEIRKKLATFSMGATSQFTLPKKWTSELSGFYNGRMVVGKATVNPYYSISVSVQRQVLNDRLTLKVYGNDIFQSTRQNLDLELIQNRVRASTRQFNDYRCIGLSLSFSFKGGQQMKGAVREAVIDESKRINM